MSRRHEKAYEEYMCTESYHLLQFRCPECMDWHYYRDVEVDALIVFTQEAYILALEKNEEKTLNRTFNDLNEILNIAQNIGVQNIMVSTSNDTAIKFKLEEL